MATEVYPELPEPFREEAQRRISAIVDRHRAKMESNALFSTLTNAKPEDPGPLTLEKLQAAMDSIPKVPPAPPEIMASPYYPRKVTGYRREPIMCHPVARWLMRLTGGDEQWGWGPWKEITRPADPVMFEANGRRYLAMHIETKWALDQTLDSAGVAERQTQRA